MSCFCLPISGPKCYCFRLANIVEGKVKQQFDKDGILFIDEDPKDFVYILRYIRKKLNKETLDISGHYAMLQMYPQRCQRRPLIIFST